MKKLAKLKEWLTIDDAAKFLSISLAEDVERKDVLQLGLDGHLTLSAHFVNHAYGLFANDIAVRDAPVCVFNNSGRRKGIPIGEFENVGAIPESVQELVGSGECTVVALGDTYHSADGSTRFLVTEKRECVRKLMGVWDLTMIGAERLDVEHEVQQLTGGPEITLVAIDGVVLRNDEQFAILFDSFDSDAIRNWDEKSGEKSRYDDVRNWHPAGGLVAVDHALVVRTERLTALIDSLSGTNERARDREPRMSDARLKVMAALIERGGINLSEARGQGAELNRLVDETGYGPVSADVCERMVKEIKNRMPDWD